MGLSSLWTGSWAGLWTGQGDGVWAGLWTGFGRASLLVLLMVLGISSAAYANRPIFAGTRASSPDAAVRFSDPSISRVIYYELTDEAPVQWFAVESDKRQELRVLLGVPAGLSRKPANPVVVLFGPGLGPGAADPPGRLELEPPVGLGTGAVVVSRKEHPERFYEPVTGTESLILGEGSVELPAPGTYYGAVYDVRREAGKLWVGFGEREAFTWRDIPRLLGWIRKARDFHEMPGWPRWVWGAGAAVLAAIAGVTIWFVRRFVHET